MFPFSGFENPAFIPQLSDSPDFPRPPSFAQVDNGDNSNRKKRQVSFKDDHYYYP